MQELRFHLTVHLPYRPVEGLMVDIKTRFAGQADPEKFRSQIEKFLSDVQDTNASLVSKGLSSYFSFWVRIMKCRVRIVIVSVVVGFILEYNH